MKSKCVRQWAVVAASVGAASTAMAVIPAQVTLNPTPPGVPCVTGGCSYAPDQYSSASYYLTTSGTGLGSALAIADFNRDGLEDLAIGAPFSDNGNGGIWLFYSIERESSGAIKLEGTDASWIPGESLAGKTGLTLAAGDVTGDGYADLVVGAPAAGLVYVLPGSLSVVNILGKDITYWPDSFTISLSDPTLAIREAFGSALAIGDVSSNSSTVLQDGKNELMVGAPGGSRAYVLYGPIKAGAIAGEKSYGFYMYGQTSDQVGAAVAMLRDIDGDGALDFAVGAPGGSVAGGKVYTIAGRSKSSYESAIGSAGLDLNSTTQLTRRRTFVGDLVYKSAVTGKLGSALTGGVDLNSDTRADFLMSAVTAPSQNGSVADVGRVYLVPGSGSFFGSGTYSPIVTSLSSSGLAYFVGNTGSGMFGSALAMTGDMDGDSLGDFLVSALAWTAAGNVVNSGSTFLLSGRTNSKWSQGMQPDGLRFDGQYGGVGAGGTLLASPTLDLDGDSHNDFFISLLGNYPTSGMTEYRVFLISSGDYWDRDVDGQDRAEGDCDDSNSLMSYRASGEVCDGYDNDCNGLQDEDDPGLTGAVVFYVDEDNDGYGDATQPSIQSCSDIIGLGISETPGDCDDTNKEINPSAFERCNDLDDDCDGAVDMDDSSIYTTSDSGLVWYYPDTDSDGYGAAKSGVLTCTAPAGYITDGTDCDDTRSTVYPDAPEGATSPGGCLMSDGIDNNCNSEIDEGTCGSDDDNDGFSEDQSDCDDSDDTLYPGAMELCDQKDNDCDQQVDEDFDSDQDGFYTAQSCKGQYDVVDCNDLSGDIYPGAAPLCDGVDTDCDGEMPDDGLLAETDGDLDGSRPCDGDCRDDDALVNPSATEICDGIDNNCDDILDNSQDADQDGSSLCVDCNDQDPDTYPGAEEQCDGVDNDCDNVVPDSGATSEVDNDSDGSSACAGDCNDADDHEYPGAPELCDGEDNDCDGKTDEDPSDGDTFYLDEDSDGEGDPDASVEACSAPRNYVANASDCDDTNSGINSQATEVCDGLDTDCNGEGDDEEPIFDRDEDGWLDAEACADLAGTLALDCDDLRADVHPDAQEVPGDGVDADCDGVDPSAETPVPLPDDLVSDTLGCSCTSAQESHPASGHLGAVALVSGLLSSVLARRRRALSTHTKRHSALLA